MRVPKNVVTGSPPMRVARLTYRRHLRPFVRDAAVAARRVRGDRYGHRPDYLIVGVQKCGTTGLFDALTASDRFGRPLVKEVRYFDRAPLKPIAWYRAHFWSRDERDQAWGEATPAYFDTPEIPGRVADLLPDVKVIALFRDPLARALSHYFHAVDCGFEHRSIADAFADEVRLLRGGGSSTGQEFMENGYLARSRYPVALQRWFDVLPPEQIRVFLAERRQEALQGASQFILGSDAGLVVRDSNSRSYRPPDDLDLRPAAELLMEACATLPAMLGWDALPVEWDLLYRYATTG
jgi:hypothetical protein